MATKDIPERQQLIRGWWHEQRFNPAFLALEQDPDYDAAPLIVWTNMHAIFAAHNRGALLAVDDNWYHIHEQLSYAPLYLAHHWDDNHARRIRGAMLGRYHEVDEKKDAAWGLVPSTVITTPARVGLKDLYVWLGIMGGYRGEYVSIKPPATQQQAPANGDSSDTQGDGT